MQQLMPENWISRVCHIETANEEEGASGADQLPEFRVLIFHSWENGKFMFVLRQKESWKSINMPIWDNYFL